MSNVNLRPIQHSAVNYGRFGLLRGALAVLLTVALFANLLRRRLYRK